MVRDANGQSLAYVYSRENESGARIAKLVTPDKARRIASNIAKLPALLSDRACRLAKAALSALNGVKSSAHCPYYKKSTSGGYLMRGTSMRYRPKIGSRTRVEALDPKDSSPFWGR